MKVRIKFKKYGPVRFIGHLDVMRFFQKTIRRAGIDVAYSSGYSPHQIMSFAAPLGLGLESNGEYMDIELNSKISSEEIIKRLNEQSVYGIEIVSAKELPDGSGNAMASVAAAGYTVNFREGKEPKFLYKEKIQDFFNQKQIIITKETKRSTAEIDLRPAIYTLEIKENAIYMIVDASSSGNIKPSMVIEAFLKQNGEELIENSLLITREETYMSDKKSKNKKLVPLDYIGNVIE